MAIYMIEVSYTAAATAALVANPQDRTKVVGAAAKKLGGSIIGFWFAFGESDVVGILEMPDNVSMAAFSLAISAGGACKSIKTTALMSIKDGMKAMKKASGTGYKSVTG